MKTNPRDMIYIHPIVHTPQDEYGEEKLNRCLERYGNRIVDFRPPRLDEQYLTVLIEKEVARCGLDFNKDTPRFILGPPPKPLKKFLVEVWDEMPQKGDGYVYRDELATGKIFAIRGGDADSQYSFANRATATEVKE